MNKISTRKGFTLIEILIVVAIIAILASSVLVGFGPAQRQGRDARRISDLRQVQNALELYYAKCGYYPGAAQSGSTCTGFSTINTWSALTTSLTGTAVANQIPNDPRSGSNYYYGTDSGGSSYIIGATLEDSNNPALQQSYKTSEFGVACASAGVYCIKF